MNVYKMTCVGIFVIILKEVMNASVEQDITWVMIITLALVSILMYA